jgi:hypothetical protein
MTASCPADNFAQARTEFHLDLRACERRAFVIDANHLLSHRVRLPGKDAYLRRRAKSG